MRVAVEAGVAMTIYRILATIGAVAGVFLLGGLVYWLLERALLNSPRGWQDKDGFHYTRRRGDK